MHLCVSVCMFMCVSAGMDVSWHTWRSHRAVLDGGPTSHVLFSDEYSRLASLWTPQNSLSDSVSQEEQQIHRWVSSDLAVHGYRSPKSGPHVWAVSASHMNHFLISQTLFYIKDFDHLWGVLWPILFQFQGITIFFKWPFLVNKTSRRFLMWISQNECPLLYRAAPGWWILRWLYYWGDEAMSSSFWDREESSNCWYRQMSWSFSLFW